MKDFLGNPLSIGDAVVFQDQDYRSFNTAIVEKFTPQFVTIRATSTSANWQKLGRVLRQKPQQLIKVPLT